MRIARCLLLAALTLVVLTLAVRVPAFGIDTDLRIGVVLPLSGARSAQGIAVQNGFELARREHPEKLATVSFRFQDTRSDTNRSITAFNRFRQFEGADLIYVWGSEAARVIAPLAEGSPYPLVVAASDPDVATGRRWIFRFGNISVQYTGAILHYLRSEGVKRIGLIRSPTPELDRAVEILRRNLRRDEVVEEVGVMAPGQRDLTPILTRLKGRQYDALAIYLPPSMIPHLYRQLPAGGSRITFGTEVFASEGEIQRAGPAMTGAVFPGNYIPPAFRERYRKAFDNDNQLGAAVNSYDFAVLVGDLLGTLKNGELDFDQIADRLRSVRERAGEAGVYSFRSDREFGQRFDVPVVLQRIEPGGIRTINPAALRLRR